MKRTVVVTGGGVVTPLGNGPESILASLRARRNFVVKDSSLEEYRNLRCHLCAPVAEELPEYPRKLVRGMGRVALLALTATERALRMAGIAAGDPMLKNGRAGIAYGSSAGDVDAMMDFYGLLVTKDSKKMNPTTYIKEMPQTCAANLSVYYGLTGRLITTNTACTSGSQSIGYAYETIASGKQDLMIAGGSEELSPADIGVFDSMFAASTMNDEPSRTPRAYDKDRDGLVIGEGAGTLILEEKEHALARGARIYGEIAGFATNTDGVHITHPNRDTMAQVMRLAIEDSGVDPAEIGYVNTHGTATIEGDIAESNATYDVFQRPIAASTIKGYIGHTLGACGAIEAWVTLLMLHEGWFAPNLNLEAVDPQCGPLGYITGDGLSLVTGYAMSNNFAFGGINTSLILKRG
ncbi:MAG: beta-ketoacyl-ACP synthase [Sphaerochaetaceae bacterium]|nr:beta-ketoacyl-ACP synthase [Spirochaetales bacterium]MDY5499113.1 beta-ketoacyl-ACP synthase [Sphaerochaetaceae bacterium]